nr:hypothetical protein [Chlorobium phaeobacteroides]
MPTVKKIVEIRADGKPGNQSPDSTSDKPSGYYRLTSYLKEYIIRNKTLPKGVHSIPEGRDRLNQLEPSFPVDFDDITKDIALP